MATPPATGLSYDLPSAGRAALIAPRRLSSGLNSTLGHNRVSATWELWRKAAVSMFRCVCLSLFFALLSGFVHADVLLSAPPESETFPTSPPTMDVTDVPAVASTTQDFASTVIDSTTDLGPISTTSSSDLETSTATSTTNGTTEAPTTQPTNATTEGPTTEPINVTTAAPTTEHTNSTTVIPSNSTTAMPTTPVPTTPPLPNPSVGDYVVRADPKSPVCLKAKMGLQFRFKPGTSFHTVNLDPNVTIVSGLCGSNGAEATLTLNAEPMTVQFIFANHTNKFYLSSLNFTLNNGNGSIFTAANVNLSLWEASLGSSYMCRKEQTFNITDSLSLNTFELQVQPFGVTENKFSTAEECFLDADLSFLVPIAVGVALGFLIILVLISYLIGRRKSRTGYQSV
ncbi:lysosome-associated membrane glycoprotein 2 isoform X2 [Salminus brasiliensis]|uniref:lysosome-associated membrane glycoprotein 2 isoform X2 n=1 Tax=Salminus brasiliensis TaxID=930266 RepID=UPI003B82CBB5